MPKESVEHRSLLQNFPSFKAQPYDFGEASRQHESLLNEQNKMERAPRPYNRRAIGGRGREWASECLKLLEALLELDDSKPVKEPVNPLKFPEYYTDVENPIDLSKVMLKFHGGAYHSLDSFTRDMRQMFNNYKNFFKEANTEIYTQVHRLSWWFEAEVTRIHEKFGKQMYFKGHTLRDPTEKRGRPPKQTPLYYEETQADAKLHPETSGRSVVEKRARLSNRQPLYYRDTLDSSPISSPVPRSSEETIVANPAENNTNIIVSINHGPCTISTNQDKTEKTSDSAHHQRSYTDPNLQRAISHLKPSTVSQLTRGLTGTNLDIVGKQKQPSTADSERLIAPRNTPVAGCVPETGSGGKANRSPRLSLSKLMLELTVSNIWFGTARIKPKKQALLSEEGLQIWYTQDEQDMPITILSEEIVRCVAHFGNNSHKHTLFIFVLPSCSKRLEALNDKYTHCSMIVVFLNIRDATSLSSLVHIFWNIGQRSMFGSIFSEVDQKGALLLLGNIKPGIMNRVANKYKGIFSPSEKGTIPDIPGLFMTYQDPNKEKGLTTGAKKRKHSVDGQQKASTSSSAAGEVTGNLPSDFSCDTLAGVTKLLAGGTFDKEFAERLGASLQQGFKEGVTEVLKNLTDNLSKKSKDADENVTQETPPEPDNGGESDIEIVIPTDSDDEEMPYASKPDTTSDVLATGEEDLAVTGEKISIRCPITQQVMTHPLKNKLCGHCYDRPGVEGLISNRKEKARCPVAGCSNITPLNISDMEHDYKLWNYIRDKLDPDLLTKASKSEDKDEKS